MNFSHLPGLQAINDKIQLCESVISALGLLRSRDYWPVYSTTQLDNHISAELRQLRTELENLYCARSEYLSPFGYEWVNGACIKKQLFDDLMDLFAEDFSISCNLVSFSR